MNSFQHYLYFHLPLEGFALNPKCVCEHQHAYCATPIYQENSRQMIYVQDPSVAGIYRQGVSK